MNENKLADRHNAGRTQWSLVDMPTIEGMVKVLEAGAKKYSAFNWKKGLPLHKQYESLMRHIVEFFYMKHDTDAETGLPVVDHMLCNVMFIAWTFKNLPAMDTRKLLSDPPEAEEQDIMQSGAVRSLFENVKARLKGLQQFTSIEGSFTDIQIRELSNAWLAITDALEALENRLKY